MAAREELQSPSESRITLLSVFVSRVIVEFSLSSPLPQALERIRALEVSVAAAASGGDSAAASELLNAEIARLTADMEAQKAKFESKLAKRQQIINVYDEHYKKVRPMCSNWSSLFNYRCG